MKIQGVVFLLFIGLYGWSQNLGSPRSASKYRACSTTPCKVYHSFVTAEYYLDNDAIDDAQQWLNTTKDLLDPSIADSTACFVHSLQSELFYYNGLFQFGKNEARKQTFLARKIKDSLLLADGFFFLGINQLELGEHQNAQRSLWRSRDFFPKGKPVERMRATVQNEHIYNNLAQAKLKLHQPDSAVWYNRSAYRFAIKANSRRGIPNAEQTFGEIYLAQKDTDSAAFYFEKSLASALKNQYFDIVLLNYGFLMQCHKTNPVLCGQYYDKGLLLMKSRMVNLAFKKLFFTKARHIYRDSDKEKLIFIQGRIIEIDAMVQAHGNRYFQNFTDQYVKNEKKLLSLEVQKLKKQKDIVFFQLLVALLLVILLAMAVMHVRRKNRINATLLRQKNEISKDLHDDIGSGISSILIHSDLLQKSGQADERQKLLLNKINLIAKEVSQRINTFIWSLNPENNSLRDFMEYLKMYAEHLFEGTPLELRFAEDQAVAGRHFLIDGKTRKNLFFSVKEIFNNALKHSRASTITISVTIVGKKSLLIEVKDNGIGMVSGQNHFGNGLKNLEKRVAEMNGTLNMESHNGLLTRLLIPLPE